MPQRTRPSTSTASSPAPIAGRCESSSATTPWRTIPICSNIRWRPWGAKNEVFGHAEYWFPGRARDRYERAIAGDPHPGMAERDAVKPKVAAALQEAANKQAKAADAMIFSLNRQHGGPTLAHPDEDK